MYHSRKKKLLIDQGSFHLKPLAAVACYDPDPLEYASPPNSLCRLRRCLDALGSRAGAVHYGSLRGLKFPQPLWLGQDQPKSIEKSHRVG